MKITDVPKAPAYVIYTDGSMDVWPCPNLDFAVVVANYRQNNANSLGMDFGMYRAVTKLPRVRVFKVHPMLDPAHFNCHTGQYIGP